MLGGRKMQIFEDFRGGLEENDYFCTQKHARQMTEVSRKYRLNSIEEPTDEMLQELMEDVAKAARESSAKAEAEKQRRLSEAADIIALRRSQRKPVHNG